MKLTRHNGRLGKNGVYNPKHNDRQFDIDNSNHIDLERAKKNVYWDCYNGIRSACIFRKNCASVPEERSAIPLQTEQNSAG